MDNLSSAVDLSSWSVDEKNLLLNTIMTMTDGSKKSYKASESSIKWDTLHIDGKSEEECKAMYQRLIHKVRKFRTMPEIITDAVAMVTDSTAKTNEHFDLPKKPPTAFSLFVMKKSKKFPELKGSNRMKVFANDWNELSSEKKESYKRKYMRLKQKYEEELDIFRQNHPNVLLPGAVPPQPPLPCKLFVESRLEKIKKKEPELSQAEAVKRLTIKYKNLSDKKKLKWINKANSCLQTYQDQCDIYLSHNPKSTLKPAVLHLSKEEQRIWNSSRGKPVTASKNVFMYFCTTHRDNFHHLSVSEQSKQLAAMYHKLSDDELENLNKCFIQDVEEYVRSYTEYYQSLSDEERSKEKSPIEVLAPYNKILENDKKNKAKKMKKESKDKLTKPEVKKKKLRLSDVLPVQREEDNVNDSDDSISSVETPSPSKRKIVMEDELVTQNKKRKKDDHQLESTSPDDLLSMWSPLKTVAEQSSVIKTVSPLPKARSKSKQK